MSDPWQVMAAIDHPLFHDGDGNPTRLRLYASNDSRGHLVTNLRHVAGALSSMADAVEAGQGPHPTS